MHMRYGILDVSAGRESLTALFFSDMHPMRARQLLSYKAAGILFLHKRPRWWKHWQGRFEGGGKIRLDSKCCRNVYYF